MAAELIIAPEAQQDLDEAYRWYYKCLGIEERIGDEHGQALTLHQLGMVAELRGSTDEAIAFYSQAEALLVRLDDPYTLGIVQESLARAQENLAAATEGDA